ncbi:AzlD domain-containing protein [Marinomonas mediterranea]|jgi:Branched-chain amino acid transport protein (AzlD).|uniref:Branched-chain amino acid transport n=1 Tax=Marinomonas mediterranea (strain ATCC 700492 / JCM 21426 / NBRC 103028 / MMB-1) TaxID=717774 RepID=F2K0B4_MARM1|nr:AzlD domain-containing protein [Marinomonas mediterranea]ADZ89829.1 branched-chain amino acid transport [Marinomonas mediterranea MMB-1]WCN07918.1 AzlD domain-containing protein [Marinomonas mediterranea]WCN12013.1 AzlD domain-containing protein [Marinomonas mediterranea]WCN16050.1 AzlD domain-containing protein [Marinomonas mediterranea MMB-1]
MNTVLILAMVLLALGTFAIRFYGTVAHKHFKNLEDYTETLNQTGSILLVSVAVTAAVFEDGSFAGVARCAGVLIALCLAYLRVNLVYVLLSGVCVTAALRAFGLH